MKKARINILGIDIDPLTMQETVNSVERYVLEKKALHLMGVNADKINQCHDEEELELLGPQWHLLNLRPYKKYSHRGRLFRLDWDNQSLHQ